MLAHCTTFSLDQQTIEGIRSLAASWATSQAGAVRKAITMALANGEQPLGVAEVLAQYRAGAVPRNAIEVQELSAEVRAARAEMDARRLQEMPPDWRPDR